MSIISITIVESAEQIVAGFPRFITLSTNLPSTIFYTTDGSTPDTFSNIYHSTIEVPTDQQEFTLKIFATNGTDASPIITQNYSTNIINNTRLPHSPITPAPGNRPSLFPFGSASAVQTFDYLNNAEAGTIVTNPSLPIIPYGYDANGNPVGANKPIDDYLNIYSVTDAQNRVYHGVGNLPGEVTTIGRRSALEYTPEESHTSDRIFHPKAMVIFQDSETDDPTAPVQINHQFFSLENLEIARDGGPLRATGLDAAGITGSYINSHYNPRTQKITSYYRCSSTNRWIISTRPYEPKDTSITSYAGMVFPKFNQGVGKIFTWNMFRYRVLT